jgi:hypothetical protein
MVFEVSHNWTWRTERPFVFTRHSPFANGMGNTAAMSRKTKRQGESKIVPSAAAELVREKFTRKVNANAKQWNSAQDMLITDF